MVRKMVTASQLQAVSANNYKYALSNDQYKALANENNTQQQQGQPLTTEEAYRQRKGLSTEKASSAQPVQAVAAAQAQPAATQNNATVAQVTQSAAPINKTSGLPQGETFQYTLSHAQQNKYVRENQSRVAQGKAALTELQFRQNISMDTSTIGGTYTAPKVTNESHAEGTPATSTKGVSNTNYAPTGSGDQKIAAVKAANPTNNNASAQTGTAQQAKATVVSANDSAKKSAAVLAENNRIAQQATADAQKAADAKRSAEQEAAAKTKIAQQAAAEARKSASATAKTAAVKAQKEAEEARDKVKIADAAAKATAKLANTYGAALHYSTIALNTGSTQAAKKASDATKDIKSIKAEAQKTSAKAKAAGVTDRTGQVLLKSGIWISQYEKKGNDSADNVTLYSANLTDAEKKQRNDDYLNRQKPSSKKLGLSTKSAVLDFDKKTGQVTYYANDKKFNDVQEFKTKDQAALENRVSKAVSQALAEAHKINPNGSKEYFEGVANVARRGQLSTTAVLKEDLARANTQVAKAIAPILPDLDKIVKVRDEFLSGITVKVTQPKKETLEYTLSDVQKKYQKKVKGNMVTGGLLKFTEDEYNSLRSKPVSYAGNAAAVYVGGEVLGAGVGALKLATKAGAGKVASKIASPVAKKALSLTGKHGVDAAMMTGMVGSVGVSTVAYFSDPTYKSLSQVDKDLAKVEYAAGMFRMGKDFIIGGVGFNKGAREVEATASRIKAMRPTAGATIKPKSSGLENALPSEFDITNVARSVKPAAPKTTAQRVTALKAQVKKLENKGKVSDKPKIRSLKRQINAITLKSKNANALADLKPKNRADIKEIANDQAFDKELASLKEMQAFAERYSGSVLNKTKPTETDLGNALSKIGSAEKVQVSRIKRGLPETKSNTESKKTTRASYVKDTPRALKSLATDAGKAGVRKAKVTTTQAKTAVKDATTPKIRKSVPGVAKYKDTSAQAMHGKLKLRAQAQRIETALDKARVSGDVSKEAYYTAQSAKFKLTHGISTEKAAKVYQFKAKTTKTLGQKRAEYAQVKAAHKIAKKSRVSNPEYIPGDITDIVRTAKAFESSTAGKAKARQAVHSKQNRLLKDAAKDKKESGLPRDITNVTGYRRAKGSASGKLTMKEIALFKAKSGNKYTAAITGSLDTLKAEASKFNKVAAEKRTRIENKRAWAEAEAKAELEEALTVSEPTRAEINRAAHEKAREQIRRERSQRREAELEYKSTKEYTEKQERHTQAREKVLKDRSAVREAKAESVKSEKAKALQEKHDAANERIRVERSAKKEAPISERARINQEAHARAHERIMQERAARKEAPISERAAANKKAHDEAHERLVRQRSAAREATKEIEQTLASVEKYVTESGDKFKAAVSRTKARNEEIRRSYGPESQARTSDTGALKLLQKAEAVVKAVEKHEKAREKRSLTVSEKRVVERAKVVKQQKARPRQRTAVKTKLEEKTKVKAKQKPEVKAPARTSRFYYAPGAGMDPEHIRFPAGASVPGIGNGNNTGFMPVNGIERTVKNIENTIYRMDNIVKQHMNNTVKQDIRVKPIVIVPTNIDSMIRPDVKPDVLVKPGVLVKPKVETILKPIVDQIEVIKSITVTPSAQGYVPKLKLPTDPVVIARKKKTEPEGKDKEYRGIVKLNRELRNKLGSLGSVFDLPSKKAATKKSTTKRTAKRVSRA